MFEDNDLIFHKDDKGTIHSAGYTIESILLQQSQPVLITKNREHIQREKIADLFKDLAIPAGLVSLSFQQRGGASKTASMNKEEVVSSSVYDALLEKVQVHNKQHKTRRQAYVVGKKRTQTKKRK